MTMADRLASLRERVAEIDQAIADIVEDNAVSVTIEGRSVTRPSIAVHRAQRERYLVRINQLESGNTYLFQRSVRFDYSGC